ncbi:MAG: hypothetical protein ACREJQ_08405 [bacterium]
MEISARTLREFVEKPRAAGRRPLRFIINRGDLEQAYGSEWESAALALRQLCVREFGYAEFEVSPEDPTIIVCLDATVFKLDPEATGSEG